MHTDQYCVHKLWLEGKIICSSQSNLIKFIWSMSDRQIWSISDRQFWSMSDRQIWSISDRQFWSMSDRQIWSISESTILVDVWPIYILPKTYFRARNFYWNWLDQNKNWYLATRKVWPQKGKENKSDTSKAYRLEVYPA